MVKIMHINTRKAQLEPHKVFSSAMDVAVHIGLTRGQKIATLKRWRSILNGQTCHNVIKPSPVMQPLAGKVKLAEIVVALKCLERRGPSAVSPQPG